MKNDYSCQKNDAKVARNLHIDSHFNFYNILFCIFYLFGGLFLSLKHVGAMHFYCPGSALLLPRMYALNVEARYKRGTCEVL